MRVNIWMFFTLVLAIMAAQYLSNRFILSRGAVEETKKVVTTSGDPVMDFLDNY